MKQASYNNQWNDSYLVDLKDNNWLDKQRIAGKIAAEALNLLQEEVKNKTKKSLKELNQLAEEFIENSGAICTFKNYKGFPAGVCISINQQLVHGLPSDYILQDGDLISFDLGTTVDGAIADTALTLIYGDPKFEEHVRLVSATENALKKGIEAIKVGRRLGVIGQAISKHAQQSGFGLITKYGGHGLSKNIPHSSPFVPNKSTENEGIRLVPNLTIAIEPLFVIGSSTETMVASDGWTVNCENICCHWEHTVYIHPDHVEIITYRGNEDCLKTNKVYFKDKNENYI